MRKTWAVLELNRDPSQLFENIRLACSQSSGKEGRRKITLGAGSPSQARISSLRVIYKMERVGEWCIEVESKLGEVILEQGKRNLFFYNEAISLC